MSAFYFEEYCYLLPFVIVLTTHWFYFVKNNFFLVRVKPAKSDKLVKTNVIKKLHYKNYVNWNLIVLYFLFVSIYLFFGTQQTFWWNHFKLTNFTVSIVLLVLFFSILLNIFLKHISKINLNYNIDYFFALNNLSVVLLLIFFTNTLYTFLFILEVNSSLIFYKFVVSKFWFKSNKHQFLNNFTKFNKVMPKYYMNMLFFQYWVNFFSSTLILYSLINLFLVYGSSEWMFVELISNINLHVNYFNFFSLFLVWLSFFIGLFLKIGFTPLHLFKIEVYKGLPFVSIFFYTVYYFLVFFLFFVILIVNYLHSVAVYWWFLLLAMLFLGGLYILVLFFDVNYTKAFFAYSTIINSYSLFCIIATMV